MYIPLEDGEKILAQVHRHWWFILMRVFGAILLALVPVAIVVVAVWAGVVIFTIIGVMALIAIIALWVLVVWTFFWQFWTTYYMDIWVVTNHRVIDIDYHRLFDRDIAILRLNQVEDISTRMQGVLPWLLRYGSVSIQTAGSNREFLIDQIANPEGLRDIISKASSELRSQKTGI